MSLKGILKNKIDFFYYKKVDANHYELFSVGPDQVPYTTDDIYPISPNSDSGISGLVKKSR